MCLVFTVECCRSFIRFYSLLFEFSFTLRRLALIDSTHSVINGNAQALLQHLRYRTYISSDLLFSILFCYRRRSYSSHDRLSFILRTLALIGSNTLCNQERRKCAFITCVMLNIYPVIFYFIIHCLHPTT